MLATTAQDFRRLRQIVGIMAKYGYGELLRKSPQLRQVAENTPGPDEATAVIGAPRRFRMMLEELGPTFIKLGQVLSARPDLVSRAYVEELKQLQYQCSPLDFDQIEVAIQDGLSAEPDTLFSSIDPEPLATASVAQVHRAVTRDGKDVVVKVQRPGIRPEIQADLDILHRIARVLDSIFEESAITESAAIVREFERGVIAELDFSIEAANGREFKRLHEGRDDIVIPSVHGALSSDTVLTLDFLDGTPFTHLPDDVDRVAIAERTVKEAFDEVFIDGFYHADPHPGNLLLLKDGRYGILDFGVYGRLTPQMRETLIVLALAVAIRDSDTAARTLYRLGHAESRVSISDLRDDVDALFEKWLGRTIRDIDSTLLLQELMQLALRHRIRIPSEYTMLGRAAATIEGLVRDFGPELDVAKVAAPYAEQLLLGRMGPDDVQGGLYKALLQFQGLSQDVPLQLSQIMADLSAGNFRVSMGGPAVDRLQQTILTAATVIAFSILGAAFVIGSFMAMSQVKWTLLGIPVASIFGAVAGVVVFSWVSAYLVVRPRIRKMSLRALFSKRNSR